MRKELKEIQEKYGEDIFRLAIIHLIQVGIEQFSKVDIDALCEKALHETPASAIMTGEYQADILRCANAICKYSVDDLLRYVKTHVEIAGVHAHPGTFISFRSNATDELIIPPVCALAN